VNSLLDDIKVESADVQPCVKKLTIEIPESAVAKEYNKALGDVKRKASIQGFRKGKAPKEILEKMYSESIIWDVGQKLITRSYEKVISDEKLNVFGQPSFENVKVTKGEPVSFTATVEIFPDVELPDFSGWKFERKITPVNEEDLKAPVKSFLEGASELVPADDRKVKENDYVVLTYKGSINGKELEQLTAENTEVYIATDDDNMLAPFYEEIIGMDKDKEKSFTVKLPKQFPDPELAEKEVSFSATVLSIKEKKLPELNDEFVSSNTPYKSVADMNEKVKEHLEFESKNDTEEQLRTDLFDRLIKETSFELPPKMLEEYASMQANRVSQRYGNDIEKTPDFDKQCLKIGERMAREEAIIVKVSDAEKIKPDKQEVMKISNQYMQILQAQGGKDSNEFYQRAVSLAHREAMTEAVYKHLLSKVEIKDIIIDKTKEKN